MTKLAVGMKLPDFEFDTLYRKNLSISDECKKADKTALVFLRYYGCPFCQFDMHEYEVHYNEITSHGGQMYVVLQSDPVRLAEKLKDHALPYQIICDPDQKLYKELEIPAVDDLKNAAGPGTLVKMAKVKAGGYKHGEYEGVETQLPATFVVDKNGIVTYAHYAKHVDESAAAEELIKELQ